MNARRPSAPRAPQRAQSAARQYRGRQSGPATGGRPRPAAPATAVGHRPADSSKKRDRPGRARPAGTGKKRPGNAGDTRAGRHPGHTARSAPPNPGRATVVEPEAPPRQITVRTLVLFLVVLMAFIVLAPTLRAYVSQAEEQRTLAAQIEAAEERNAQLQRTLDRWEDPAYVQAQARERLGFVNPGETAYVVVDPESVTGEDVESDPRDDGPVLVPQVGPWYLTVVDSVHAAGEVGQE